MKATGIFTALVLLAGASITSAATIQIDLGRSDNITSDSGWNNVTSSRPPGQGHVASDNFTLAGMVDSTGAATAIDLSVDFTNGGSWAGGGADFTGTPPAPFTSDPATAVSDSMFIRGTPTVLFTFSDLAPGTAYSLDLWGARGNNQLGDDVSFDVTDASGTSTGSYNGSLNNLTVVSFSGTVPGSGELTVLYSSPIESGALNAIKLDATPIPEPSSILLIALGAVGLATMRRW